MSTEPLVPGIDELRRNWWCPLVMGILLIVLGAVALNFPLFTTMASMLYYGWVLIIGAVLHLISVFYVRRWQGFALHLVAALLSFMVGMAIVEDTAATTVILTLVIAILLIVGGLFRLITAFVLQYPNWGWSAASGLITFILGGAVWRRWPSDAYWFIGTCVAIDLIMQGWGLFMLGMVLRPRKIAG